MDDTEYADAVSVANIFGRGQSKDKGTRWGNGVKTNRDGLLVADTRSELIDRFELFEDHSLPDSILAHRLNLVDGPYWNTERERKKVLAENWRNKISPYCYRPFSNRWILFQTNLIEIRRGGASKFVMKHMLHPNVGLIIHRTSSKQLDYTHFFAVTSMLDVRTFPDREGVPYIFPLYFYDDEVAQTSLYDETAAIRRPNLCRSFLSTLALALGLPVSEPHGLPEGISPEKIFAYSYAVFFSPIYRSRYAEFLRTDFPRLFLPGSRAIFHTLTQLGDELLSLHILKSQKLDEYVTTPVGLGRNQIEKVSYSNETVWIDKEKSCGFQGVSEDVWNFHIGGYQVCHKWLRDRQAKGGKNPRPGKILTDEDIDHYQKIVVALSETIRIMAEIDQVIEQHGGWPKAFKTA